MSSTQTILTCWPGAWCAVLGYAGLDRVDGSIEIGPPEAGFGGPQPAIVLDRTDEPSSGKLRLHIDVNATGRDQEAKLRSAQYGVTRREFLSQAGSGRVRDPLRAPDAPAVLLRKEPPLMPRLYGPGTG